MAQPMIKLTGKDVPFVWSPECENQYVAFLQRISLTITSLIILHTIPPISTETPITQIYPDAPTMILIDGICVNTVNMYYCEQSIISKLDNPHSEITTVTKIAVFNALYISESTVDLIRDNFLPKAENPLAETQLQTCLATYNNVEKLMEGAYKAMLHNEYSEMRRYQSSVLGVLDNCKSDFDLMVRTNSWVRLMINISIFASRKLPAP
ncbi:PREDICTED: uncharacterized protein LOC104789491 [Camelina sativa]|uniref:Uncharacterized protein LOC104789491 n=1 Tax=Camelina sativa TaxID=90675 RepID=A0ABM1RPG6_CAMSA|nr:PREDICTED: uncharacterized protein LOC104789491 [Camelina sativa]